MDVFGGFELKEEERIIKDIKARWGNMAQAIDRFDREGLRNVIREINLDDYKQSNRMADLIEEDRKQGTSYKDAMLTEDELINVIQYLRSPSGRGDKTRLDYMVGHERDRSGGIYSFPNAFGDVLMEEKKKEEMEYAREMGRECPIVNDGKNVFMKERVVAQPQKPSLDDIKARYMKEMDALTKKFQEEINNLG